MIVVDASVAVKAYFEEAGSDAATALLTGQEKLLAPELIRIEVSAALCRRVRKGEFGADEAKIRCEHWLTRLKAGLFTLMPDQELLPAAIDMAVALKHPLQDCLYLAAARVLDAKLVTADRAFLEKASASYGRISLLGGCERN